MKIIPLMPKADHVPVAFVDSEDYELLAKYTWFLNGSGYATRNMPGQRKTIFMHREVMNAPAGSEVHHHNANTLDNRKANLVLCTRAENVWATRKLRTDKSSIYKGVTLIKKWAKNPWMAQLKKHGKNYYLGSFPTEAEAAMAYNRAAVELYGDFAQLNKFPDGLATEEGEDRHVEFTRMARILLGRGWRARYAALRNAAPMHIKGWADNARPIPDEEMEFLRNMYSESRAAGQSITKEGEA